MKLPTKGHRSFLSPCFLLENKELKRGNINTTLSAWQERWEEQMWCKSWKCLDLQNTSFIPFWTDLKSMPYYSTADDFLWKSFEYVLHHGAEWLGLAGVAALPSSTRTASAFALFPAPPQWVGWRWARIWAGSQPGQPSQMEQRDIPCCTTSQSAVKGFLRKQTLLRSWLDLLVYSW